MEGLIVRGTLSSMAFCNVLFRRGHPWMCSAAARCYCMATPTTSEAAATPLLRKHALLLDRMKNRESRDAAVSSRSRSPQASSSSSSSSLKGDAISKSFEKKTAKGFDELGLGAEVMGALAEMGINVPTEIQFVGIPPVIEGTSVVLASHTGSGKTLAYLLPIVQLLRTDELSNGITMRPRRPKAVVLCPTRELCEQVFRVAKVISHHARFRSVMIGGGGRIGAQKDLLSSPVDMVVGTPGRVLQHIVDKHIVYGDIKYLVIDEADMMFDQGFGPDLKKFMGPLKRRASKEGDEGYQTVMVAATMTKAVQRLINDEFQGIKHVQTSTLHKKISSARHSFVLLSGNEDKMESLLQILEPSMSKANRVMIFCNTLGSSRAVAHFLTENNIYNVNYHGAVPAQERVENLKKFKAGEGDCPAMVCSDLGSRGLDLDVDHVILFDFPSTSIDYLHRSGRTARMGAKGKVTSLVTKRDIHLAKRIEEAIKRNENLESLTKHGVWRENMMNKVTRMRRSKASSARTLLDKKLSKRNPSYSAKTYGRARSRSDRPGPRLRSRPGSGPSERARPRPRPSPGGEPKEARSRPRPAWARPSSVEEDEPMPRRQKKNSPRKNVGSKVPVTGFRGKSSQF